VVGEERNARWLGREPTLRASSEATTAAGAVSQIDAVFDDWRAHLAALDDDALAEPLGAVAGAFASSSRLAFALHIADEYIHHAAESALLRDLYTSTGQV
jgi:DinB superfamily